MKTFWTNFSSGLPGVTVIVTQQDSNGTIVGLGDAALLSEARGADRVEDLEGLFVAPGFWDSHFHLLDYGRSFRRLRFDAQANRSTVLNQVRAEAARVAPGEWIIGGGWNKESFEAPPHWSLLDEASPNHPVLLMSLDYHTAWVNRLGAQRLGIDEREEAELVRDPHGQWTGILHETRAFRAQEEAMRQDDSHLLTDLKRGVREAQRRGLVGVTTMEDRFGLLALQDLAADERMLRVQVFLRDRHAASLLDAGIRAGFGDDFLRLFGIKRFMDGALGSQTAWMKSPYETGTGNRGMGLLTEGDLREEARMLAEQGLLVAVHAIGDQAVSAAVSALRSVAPGPGGRRSRIEHAQLIDTVDLDVIQGSALALSMQPVHLLFDRPIADRHWGDRSRHAFRFRDILARGVPLIFGSDAPVADADPVPGLWAAVHRGAPIEEPWYSEQRLTAEEAIWAYTRGPALVDARPAGLLQVGLWGDFTLWRTDPREALIHREYDALAVAGTVVAGRRIW